MNYLVDTCVISEVVRPKPQPSVVAWLQDVDESSVYLSVPTLGELWKGVAKLAEGPRKHALEEWLNNDLKERFAGRVVDIDKTVAATWGRLQGEAERNGRPLPVVDSLLAACALVHGLTVVTRDTSAMSACGARVLNPWTGSPRVDE